MTLETSVIICAYTEKRWDDLVAAVESVRGQRQPAHEIIVVIDHNPVLLERIKTRFPDQLVIENREAKGLSGARNTGIALATGELIAFLDDDAVAASDWLEALHRHLQDNQVLGAGGKIEPLWSGNHAWLPSEFYWVVGCTYRGVSETSAPIRNLIGASMCIRREVFDAVGGFTSGMGRIDTVPLGCEETELCIRARQHWPDRRFMYEPAAKVGHHVPANRVTWAYFCSRCYAEGLSKAAVARLVGANDGLASERTYTLQTLPSGVLLGLRDVLRGDLVGFARAVAIIAGLGITVIGYGMGSLSLRRAHRSSAQKTVNTLSDKSI